mgnify:CR=1 FL=1|tara:strand:- start:4244 stop:4645 length:402 start_codon:yes stop_codon:yes gene_type:complete
MKLSQYEEDTEKQEKGSPCYLYDASFDVKRSGTPIFNKEIQAIKSRLYDFAARDIDMNLIMGTWLAESGVTGWDGVLDEDDNELKYSRANAHKVFLNPAFYNSLNLLLLQHAADYNNYLHDELEKDLEAIKKK